MEGSQALRPHRTILRAFLNLGGSPIYLAFIFPAVYLTSFEPKKRKEKRKLCANISPCSASLHSPPLFFSVLRYFRTPPPSPALPAIASSRPFPFQEMKAGNLFTSQAMQGASTSRTARTPWS